MQRSFLEFLKILALHQNTASVTNQSLTGGFSPLACMLTTNDIFEAFYDDYETAVSFAKPGDRIIVDFDRFLTVGDEKIQDFAVLDYEKACSFAGNPEFEKATSMFDVWVIGKGAPK